MSVDTQPPPSRSIRTSALAYLELLRLPNVFTAMADVVLGYLLIEGEVKNPWLLATLVGASSALYLGGMVLNDVFDVDLDRKERPSRPIPSGRVSLPAAVRLGFGLLAVGLGLGWLGALQVGIALPGHVVLALACLIWTYDLGLKNTPFAPLGMGVCRMLNVQLGMSIVNQWADWQWLVAAGIGVYIAGVTWFARTEATVSRRGELIGATLVMLAGIGMVVAYPAYRAETDPPFIGAPDRWYQFWAIICALVIWRCVRAVIDPRAIVVQMAVKSCILSLIVIDAAACLATTSTREPVLLLLLLVPAVVLGRWIYST